jgi:hypothetical protein
MKKFFTGIILFIITVNGNMIFAQQADVPYLSDDDIAAIEITLPDDVPEIRHDSISEIPRDSVPEIAVATADGVKNNEISRLNTSDIIYHLLILDRKACQLNADINDADNFNFIYKFKHGADGYLIAIYTSSPEGPVFPQLPDRSRIIVNMTTVRPNTIKEYINSDAFRRFVKTPEIISGIQKAVNSIK